MKTPESTTARMMIDVDKAHACEKTSLSKCGFEERESAFNLITNLVLKEGRPALLVLITRKPVCRTLKHNRNTGDRIAVHEPFLEKNSGYKDLSDYAGCFAFWPQASDQKWPWIFSITTIWMRAAHMTTLLISGTTISAWRRWLRKTISWACHRTPTPSPSPWKRPWAWTILRRVRA